MSAFVVDPRTVDYIISWATLVAGPEVCRSTSSRWDKYGQIPSEMQVAAEGSDDIGYRLNPVLLDPNVLGQILLAENVKSVRFRYQDAPADDLPGPASQLRVWRYRFQPVEQALLHADWTISACDCIRYQSCETDAWESCLAADLLNAIRETAIGELTEDAPGEITEALLARHATIGAALDISEDSSTC